MSALTKLKTKALAGVETVANVAGLFVSVSGATVAAVFGKLVIGLVLGAVALGFVLRLKSRRAAPGGELQRMPGWVRPLALLASAAEVAALVESVNLPVRMSQDGFVYGHWYLVVLTFVALYLLQVGVLRRVAAKRAGASVA